MKHYRVAHIVLVAIAACGSSVLGSAVPPLGGQHVQNQEIAAALDREIITAETSRLQAAVREDLRALYHATGALLWTDADGGLTPASRTALDLLARSAEDGLRPADYLSARLRALAATLDAWREAPASDLAAFDVSLSLALLRYMRELRAGRIDARTLRFPMSGPSDGVHLPAVLRSALARGRISSIPEALAPPLVQYGALRRALASYRTLSGDAALRLDLPVPATVPVRPGQPYAGAGALHRRLVALGDLSSTAPPPPASIYSSGLAEGVRHFQRRHGLVEDGVIGKATWSALQVPLGWRVRQIELALERLRWLPRFSEERVIAIAIPMFRLWAWDDARQGASPALSMKVIVGRGAVTETPVLLDELEYLVFAPYWNVPGSIARHEILPAVARDPGYLRKHSMEIVRGDGDDAQPLPETRANLDRVRSGTLRIRQLPGPQNALGLIKFVFPNVNNVYLHGTPGQSLFARSRRDFSHGCVRVEDPIALAEWALDDRVAWDRQQVALAASTSYSRRVDLDRPVRIVLFYTTAVVLPEDGAMYFVEDIYRRDAPLDEALQSISRDQP